MATLVVGASGATGRQLVEQLLKMGQKVKVIVRSTEKLPQSWHTKEQVFIIKASVLDISEHEMAGYLKDCQAVASCLGHNSLYGKPRKLVTEAVAFLCRTIVTNAPEEPVKLVLMNTAGNRNRDLHEPVSWTERLIIGLLRLLLPPHPDNEKAADYLRVSIGQKNPWIEWVVVRPDNLTDQDMVSEYELYASPTRSAIFDPGKSSRSNVGHFMAKLITENDIWHQWKGQMPVIYNKET